MEWKLHIELHISTRAFSGRSRRAGPLLPSEGSGNRRCVPECGAAEGVGRQNGGHIHQNHQVPRESRVRAFRHGPKGKPSGRCSGGHAIHGRRGKKKSQRYRPTSCPSRMNISLIRTTVAAAEEGLATARLLKTEPESMKMALSRTPQPWLCRSRLPTTSGAPHSRLAPCPLRFGRELCPSNQGRDGEGPGEGRRYQLPRTGAKPSNGSAADGSDSGENMEVSGWESASTSPGATSMNSILGWRLRRKRLCSIA